MSGEWPVEGDERSRTGNLTLRLERTCRRIRRRLAQGALVALLVAAAGAGGADDNHPPTLAAVLVGGHGEGEGEGEGEGNGLGGLCGGGG